MNQKQKDEAIESWKTEGPIREAERVKTGKRYLDPESLDDFNAKMAVLRTQYPSPTVPAMPTITNESKTKAEAMAGYFEDSETECPNESEQR